MFSNLCKRSIICKKKLLKSIAMSAAMSDNTLWYCDSCVFEVHFPLLIFRLLQKSIVVVVGGGEVVVRIDLYGY